MLAINEISSLHKYVRSAAIAAHIEMAQGAGNARRRF